MLISLGLFFSGFFLPAFADKTAEQLFQTEKQAVVQIDTTVAGVKTSTGTGFIVEPGHLVVTNAHVISAALAPGTRLRMSTVDNEIFSEDKIQVTVCHFDKNPDLCVLKVKGLKGSSIPFAATAPAQGSDVFTIGHPHDYRFSVSKGMVNGVRQNSQGHEDIQFNAPISNGNSGGPLFDEKGNLVGVVTSAESGSPVSQNLNFAISVSEVKKVLKEEAHPYAFELFREVRKDAAVKRAKKANEQVSEVVSPAELNEKFKKHYFSITRKDPLWSADKKVEFSTPQFDFKCSWKYLKRGHPGEYAFTCEDLKSTPGEFILLTVAGRAFTSQQLSEMRSLYDHPPASGVLSPDVQKLIGAGKSPDHPLKDDEKDALLTKVLVSHCNGKEEEGKICEQQVLNKTSANSTYYQGQKDFPGTHYALLVVGASSANLSVYLKRLARAILIYSRLADIHAKIPQSAKNNITH